MGWDYRAIVKLFEPEIKKLEEKCIECIFLGYAKDNIFYRFIVIEHNNFVEINTIVESRDDVFFMKIDLKLYQEYWFY